MTAVLAQLSCFLLPMLKERNETEEYSCHLPFTGVPIGCKGECLEGWTAGDSRRDSLVFAAALGACLIVHVCASLVCQEFFALSASEKSAMEARHILACVT